MFCNHCGTKLDPASNFCRACGKSLIGPTPAPPVSDNTRYHRRLHLLAMFWVVVGVLTLIPSVVAMGIGRGFDVAWHNHGPFFPFSPFAFMLGGGFVILGLGAIFVGYGLMHYQPWARMAAIILGIMFIFHPPFGTALGVFTLIVLLSHSGSEHYAGTSRTQ